MENNLNNQNNLNKLKEKTYDKEIQSRKNHKAYTLIGVVIFIFAVVGLAFTIMSAVDFGKNIINKSELKAEIEKEIYPLVTADIPAFESVDLLDQRAVISAGAWDLLLNEQNKDKYETDEFGTMQVPAVDVEVYIKQLFGGNIEIKHQSIPDTQFYIPYDEEKKVYYIPSVIQTMSYAPRVTNIVENEKSLTVTVGYIAPGPFWNLQENAQNNTLTKNMIYEVQKEDDGEGYIVTSVKIKKENRVESTSSTSNTSSNSNTSTEE